MRLCGFEVGNDQPIAPTVPFHADLEQRTVRFVRSFVGSDLPEVVKEAALAVDKRAIHG